MAEEKSESNVPHGIEYVRALTIPDRAAFIRDIPDRVVRLRLRNPALTWSLNLSVASLKALDKYMGGIIDGILAEGKRVNDVIERELVEDIVAYVGEVIVRNANGRWEPGHSATSQGPLMIYESTLEGKPFFRGLDVCSHVLDCLGEGGAFSDWYQHEIN
jgi:hypothetical protein